jgi:hypothetical protein
MDKRTLPKIGDEVSRLGMGLMRLPANEKGIIYPEAEAMIDRLMEAGVNYYDTARFYHEGTSEDFAKRALVGRHPRDSFNIATKMPLGDAETQGAQVVFDDQQKKLGVDLIDFYLCHGINGGSIDHMAETKADECITRMKKDGRIRRAGFSWHGETKDLPKVLDGFPWDFVMVQLNYYDWLAGDAKELYDAVTDRGLPLIVMEPVRGGGLSNCHPDIMDFFKKANPGVSVASWALRWAGSLPGVDIVLSGMSSMEQAEDNINLFSPLKPLSDEEHGVIKMAMDAFKKLPLIPCTECNYCDKCPKKIPIKNLLSWKNDVVRFGSSWNLENYKDWTKPENQITACTECGVCEKACPQGLNIIERLKGIDAEYK